MNIIMKDSGSIKETAKEMNKNEKKRKNNDGFEQNKFT